MSGDHDEIRGTDENRGTGGVPGDGIRGTARGTAPVPLSVLDLVTVGAGHTASQAVRTAVGIARTAERRGFHRYWVAEHHSMPGVASSSPRCCWPTSPRTPTASGWAPAASCCPTTRR